MLHNIYPTASTSLKAYLANALHRAITCKGHADCTRALRLP